MIMVTFTKLPTINIVARSLSLSFNKRLILESEKCSLYLIAPRSEGEREKKAISEAEIKAETSNNTPANRIAITADTEGAWTCKPSKTFANWHK